jgi:hypothetical protein
VVSASTAVARVELSNMGPTEQKVARGFKPMSAVNRQGVICVYGTHPYPPDPNRLANATLHARTLHAGIAQSTESLEGFTFLGTVMLNDGRADHHVFVKVEEAD